MVKNLLVERGFTKVEIGRKIVFFGVNGGYFLWVQNWTFNAIEG